MSEAESIKIPGRKGWIPLGREKEDKETDRGLKAIVSSNRTVITPDSWWKRNRKELVMIGWVAAGVIPFVTIGLRFLQRSRKDVPLIIAVETC